MPHTTHHLSGSLVEAPTTEIVADSSESNQRVLHPISAKIEKELYKKVKTFSIIKEKRFNDLIEEALKGYLELHG